MFIARPLLVALLVAGCRAPATPSASLTPAERAAIADSVRSTLTAAADLSGPNVVARLMSLYPDTGAVISAAAGRVTTTRAELEANIATFWRNIGQNMRDPRWEWGPMYIEVLGRDAAVVTAVYHIPHITPQGRPHVVGGAWTAVFQRRGGRWVIIQEHLSDAPPIG
jgi:ketosteroid isomerase-like protein